MSRSEVLRIPEGIIVPCVEAFALFNTPDLDPDVTDWLASDPVRQGYIAEKKRAAEERAVAVCMRCSIMVECRQWAVTTGQYGVLGGTTEAERGGDSPVDDYLRTGKGVDKYMYVEKRLAQKVPRRKIADDLEVSLTTVRHIHKMNLIVPPDRVVSDDELYKVTKKLFKAGIPQRLVAERLGRTLHAIRRAHQLGAEKQNRSFVAAKVEKNYHKRWSRLTPTTVIVYNYLAFQRAGAPVDKETILDAVSSLLPVEEKLKGVPKGRVFKTKKHRLRIGARRSISAALRAGVRSDVLEKAAVAGSDGGTVEYYRFSPEWVQRWGEYSRAKNEGKRANGKRANGKMPVGETLGAPSDAFSGTFHANYRDAR